MSFTPDLTFFGKRLKACLQAHFMDVAELADRAAIEEERLDALCKGTGNPVGYYELLSIAGAFRIEPSILLSNVEKFTKEKYNFAAFYGDPCFTTVDNITKINETLTACRFLQNLWEKKNLPGCQLQWHIDKAMLSALGNSPEEAGKKAARQFREKINVPHNMIVPNLRQYARKVGVHVFRQKLIDREKDEQRQNQGARAICLFGQIGNNENGRIVIYDAGLAYCCEQYCIAHELGHAFMGNAESQPSISLYNQNCQTKSEQIRDRKIWDLLPAEERMVDTFAWELLLPHEYLLDRAERIRAFDLDALIRFSEEVCCCWSTTVNKLKHEGLISMSLRDAAEAWCREKKPQSPSAPYSRQLQKLRQRLQDNPKYTDNDREYFWDMVDRGLSHHFVEVCEEAFDDGDKDEIIAACADIFSVSPLRMEKVFDMYGFIKEPELPSVS